ncbi:uncharacterized protein LOC142590020 isoform X4 [Dermacentor variabilis]|uniref:uncharacterized protein LOC142590020 isoform X4 n=1 Tax=Dermacentor variabilis TaxID=34621 RepID=UPI003F5C9A73
MSLAESITAKTACHAPSIVIGQVEVGTQCSFPLVDKSVGCSFRAGSESRSVQTTETVDQSYSTTGFTNAMSLAESITAKTACHAPSIVIGQVEVGTQCSFPLVDKSVGCSFRAGSESRSVQTTETVDQSYSTTGIYLTTGAFRTSPVESHYVESNKLSLRLQRPYSSVTYYLKWARDGAASGEEVDCDTFAFPQHPGLLFLHQQPMVTIHSRDSSAKIIFVTMELRNCFVWKHLPESILANICLSAICALRASQKEIP